MVRADAHQLRQDKHQDMRQKKQKLTSASWLRPVCSGFHNLIRFNCAPFFASCRRHRVLTDTCLDACRCAAYLTVLETEPSFNRCIFMHGITDLVDLGRFFSFLILYTVGRTPWTRDQPVAGPLATHGINVHRHPCHEWDWNSRPQCSNGRRRFIPYTARPLQSVTDVYTIPNSLVEVHRRCAGTTRRVSKASSQQVSAFCLHLTGFLPGSHFHPENEDITFFRNVCGVLLDFLHSPRHYSWGWALASWTSCLHSSLFRGSPSGF
jgi:hypothetical protein